MTTPTDPGRAVSPSRRTSRGEWAAAVTASLELLLIVGLVATGRLNQATTDPALPRLDPGHASSPTGPETPPGQKVARLTGQTEIAQTEGTPPATPRKPDTFPVGYTGPQITGSPTEQQQAHQFAVKYGCGDATITFLPLKDGKTQGGEADTEDNLISIGDGLPADWLENVVAHECGHLLQRKVFDSELDMARTLDAIYRQKPYATILGVEQNADCMTAIWGLPIQMYVKDCTGARGDAARAIIAGHKP